jgi:hypothetical protein
MTKNQFSIYNVQEEKTDCIIPNDFLPLNLSGEKPSVISVQNMAKRMQLLNDSKIRILSEDNLDTILSFEKNSDGIDVPKIESICKMDNMPDKILDKHIFVDQVHMKREETMTRLMRCMRFHKTWLKHGKVLL